jgi:hypothetical protein
MKRLDEYCAKRLHLEVENEFWGGEEKAVATERARNAMLKPHPLERHKEGITLQ